MKMTRSAIASSLILVSYAVSQILRLSSNLVMTKLLVPEMFGIMAICQTVIFMLNMLSDIGINPSIIRSKRGEEPEFFNTAWTLQVLRGGIIGFLVVLAAIGISVAQQYNFFSKGTTFSEPILVEAMLWISIVPIITGLKSTNIVLANRRLQVGRLSLVEITSQIIGLAAMISWALISPDIYALVAGTLVGAISITILSHTLIKGDKNSFALEASAVREIINFGKWILGTSLLTAILTQGDRLIFGALTDAKALGIYSIAVFLATSITQAIYKLNNLVFFPILSETARGDRARLGVLYYKIRAKIDLIVITSSGFLFSLGGTIVAILYDEQYKLAGDLLETLSLSLLLISPVVSSKVYLSIGKSKLPTILAATECIFKLSFIPILFIVGGMKMAVWAVAVSAIVIVPIDWYFKSRLKILNVRLELQLLPLFIVTYFLGELAEPYVLKFFNLS